MDFLRGVFYLKWLGVGGHPKPPIGMLRIPFEEEEEEDREKGILYIKEVFWELEILYFIWKMYKKE